MDMTAIDLSKFTLQKRDLIESKDGEVYRSEFDHGLIIVTKTDEVSHEVTLSANYQWVANDHQWQPDLSQVNPNFVDPFGIV